MHFSKPLRLPLSTRHRTDGFTLAEVALSLAIFSFALLSMLGLLSVGLKTSRKANLQTAASNLLSSIAADIQASLVNTSEDENTTTFTSPSLALVATRTKGADATSDTLTVAPDSMILTDAGTDGAAMSPVQQGALKLFKVTFTASAQNASAVRIKIAWPATTPVTARPEGAIESLVPLPVR